MTPEAEAIHVPRGMTADQIEMLAECRIRKMLLDPEFPNFGSGTFVDNHQIQGLTVSYWGPTGKRVVISQDDESSINAQKKGATR
ncbi:hypothetical protein EBZ39_02860 [bacterium]|nr:hypothetical protein [bacterium]